MASNETILKNRYRLVAQQGSGGMAVIYKAIDLELSRTVAVKILRPSLTNDPAFLSDFRNQARSVANLNHPNIIAVHDVGNDGPTTHFIVMEFVEGQNLKYVIKTNGILDIDRALKLSVQICSGIGFAHRAGLIHSDVKPQNILVTRGDIVKVTDFGIAQAFSDTKFAEQMSVVWGSPHYFAPEQARGEKPTSASDVYAIGIMIFEMLTGRLPYVGADQQQLALAHISERVPLVTEYNPSIPETLAQIVYRVMSKDPLARYRTADQLGNVLENYRDRSRNQSIPNTATYRPPPFPPTSMPEHSPQNTQKPLPFSQPLSPSKSSTEPQTSQSVSRAISNSQVNQSKPNYGNITSYIKKLIGLIRKEPLRVFISYRRIPSAMLATLLATRLQSYDVSIYVDTRRVDGSGPFPTRLVQAIQQSDILICLLADTTLDSDWVRQEIDYALSFNIPMIPVFQESYKPPSQEKINKAIHTLLQHDGIHVLDIKNVYIDDAIRHLEHMIKTTVVKKYR